VSEVRVDPIHTVLVLGGYGFFGARISGALARSPDVRVLIGGRDEAKALQQAAAMGLPPDRAIGIDASANALAQRLAAARVDTLIHTAGPFQGQDYRVAGAAIAARCNYIDLADGRGFVSGIASLDAAARAAGVSVVSGASSVPALSSAVVDRYRSAFETLESIRIGIGSGGRAPGLATLRGVFGVFGYCGKPIRRWQNGAWVQTHGWLDPVRHRFPEPVGTRWLGSCDVPDLELFPTRYAPVRTVSFHAGFASRIGHFAVWLGARLVKAGVISSLAPFAGALHRLSGWIEPLLSDQGGMFIELSGIGRDSRPLTKCWSLVAAQNHGPHIPCGASIALARKLAAGVALPRGAYPCVGLLSVDEYLAPLSELDIREVTPEQA
jgi:hypothetical protein